MKPTPLVKNSVGRPLEFDKEEAIQSAMEKFWEKGYVATSLRDLLDCMGISRGSFYHAFQSKEDLFALCMNRHLTVMIAELRSLLEHSPSGRAFFETVFINTASDLRPRSSFIMNSVRELASENPQLLPVAHRALEEYSNVLSDAVAIGKSDGSIKATTATKSLGYYLVSALSGLKSLVQLGMPASELSQVSKAAMMALEH